MNGFTDIHTHILPGVDDGAKDLSEALALVRMAWMNGTRTMFLTPHYRGVYKRNSIQLLREKYEQFSAMAAAQCPGMRLYLGNEIYYEANVPEKLESGQILTMNDSRYVLLEFSGASLRSHVLSGVSEVVRYGYIPIIAHVERYDVFHTNPDLVSEVLNYGALLQVNAQSVMGENGFKVKRFCHKLLKQQMVHFVASDAHDALRRAPILRQCFLRVQKKYGAQYASWIFFENAEAMISNLAI